MLLSAFLAAALIAAGAGGALVRAAPADFPDGFRAHHTYAELRNELQELAAAHPSIVSLRSIGRSFEGRKLLAVKISDSAATDENEPEVYVDGGIHGHEHASTEQALALIHWLVDGYATNERTTAIVEFDRGLGPAHGQPRWCDVRHLGW